MLAACGSFVAPLPRKEPVDVVPGNRKFRIFMLVCSIVLTLLVVLVMAETLISQAGTLLGIG